MRELGLRMHKEEDDWNEEDEGDRDDDLESEKGESEDEWNEEGDVEEDWDDDEEDEEDDGEWEDED